jgi:hypothetical protein
VFTITMTLSSSPGTLARSATAGSPPTVVAFGLTAKHLEYHDLGQGYEQLAHARRVNRHRGSPE